jgi:hypothetical protein
MLAKLAIPYATSYFIELNVIYTIHMQTHVKMSQIILSKSGRSFMLSHIISLLVIKEIGYSSVDNCMISKDLVGEGLNIISSYKQYFMLHSVRI